MPRPATELLYTTIESPFGELLLIGDGTALRGLYMQDGLRPVEVNPLWRRKPAAFTDARLQLEEYFAGRRTDFDLALKTRGSPFQLRVWRALRDIPYGKTISYGELGQCLRPAGTPRAVGGANADNPISILIPCHRVIGANGALTGYAGGLAAKRRLLDLEAGIGGARLAMPDSNR